MAVRLDKPARWPYAPGSPATCCACMSVRPIALLRPVRQDRPDFDVTELRAGRMICIDDLAGECVRLAHQRDRGRVMYLAIGPFTEDDEADCLLYIGCDPRQAEFAAADHVGVTAHLPICTDYREG